MDFIALDVETANENFGSICAIGIAGFKDGELVKSLEYLIDPQDHFSQINIDIHGITPAMVAGAPNFAGILPLLTESFGAIPIAYHTHFDRAAVNRAAEAAGLPAPLFAWIDTARIARRTWPRFSQRGYGLKNLAKEFGFNFIHHTAPEDARCAGLILLKAISDSGLGLAEWQALASRPLTPRPRVALEGNPDGDLAGEVICFTGALTLPRATAAALAADLGCDVRDSVTTATTILVVGEQDLHKTAGQQKSSKHRKAEDMIAKGQAIRIVGEHDFLQLGVS
jgi:DNA polymerase-3 subunit epsilon